MQKMSVSMRKSNGETRGKQEEGKKDEDRDQQINQSEDRRRGGVSRINRNLAARFYDHRPERFIASYPLHARES